MPKGVYAAIPKRQQLQHWERVCCYMEAHPYRAIAFPFPLDPPISAKLLKRMAQYKLVRHCDDCTWRVSRRWPQILARLAKGIKDAPREQRPTDEEEATPTPFVVDTGVDTLYVSLFGEALPEPLVAACDYYKELAQEEDTSVETDWKLFDAPLSMYKAGVGTAKSGRGVSWSFLLRNASVQLLLRRTPLNDLLGSVRLSAECLWTYGAKGALDGMYSDLDDLWHALGGGGAAELRFQLSQIHLCADVAHFTPTPADLDRVLTRSIKKAVYTPSLLEELAPDPAVSSSADEGWDDYDASALFSEEPWSLDALPPEWAGVPLDFYSDADEEDADDADEDEGDEGDVDSGDDAARNAAATREEESEKDDEAPADEEGAAAYLWGQRVSGFAFSQGGDLSATWYDKALEERLSGKLWMRPIHAAGGWQPGMSLLRVEARFRRGILRELAAAHGQHGQHGQGGAQSAETAERWFDDPWQAIAHLHDLWAYYAGLPPEADTAPDVTYRGWMRLALPDPDDQRRARWRTDPTWEVIQRARFQADPPTALKRLPKKAHDLNQVDTELYGLLKLRAALRGEYLTLEAQLAQEVGDFLQRMEEVDEEKGRLFAEEVREKARLLGKPVPMRPVGLLRVGA